MLDQPRRRWSDVVQMLYKCFVLLGSFVWQPQANVLVRSQETVDQRRTNARRCRSVTCEQLVAVEGAWTDLSRILSANATVRLILARRGKVIL